MLRTNGLTTYGGNNAFSAGAAASCSENWPAKEMLSTFY